MRPAAFDYVRVASVADAVDALTAAGAGACVLAGGQGLVNELRSRAVRPAAVVDISAIASLRGTTTVGGELAVGALTRMVDLLDDPLVQGCAALREAAGRVGDPQVRNRATVAGNLLNREPVSDIAAVLLATRGRVLVRDAAGERSVDAEGFLRDPAAALGGGLVVELRFGLAHAGSAFAKLSRRFADAAVASAAATVTLDGDRITGAGLGLSAVHRFPLRPRAVEDALVGRPFDAEHARRELVESCRALDPPAGPHADVEHRRDMAVVVALDALRRGVAAAERSRVR